MRKSEIHENLRNAVKSGDLELVRDRFKLNGIIKKSNLGFIDIKATKNIENKTS